MLRVPEYSGSLECQGYADIDSITDITWEDLEDIGITKLGTDFALFCFSTFSKLYVYKHCSVIHLTVVIKSVNIGCIVIVCLIIVVL